MLAIIMSIPPTFPFFFYMYDIGYYHVYSSNVSCFNVFAELLWTFFHWREDRSVWEESVPSEADRNNAIFKLNLHGYTSLFRHAVSSTSF